MRHEPRYYQQAAADDAVAFLRSAGPGDRRLYAAPTGSGKSLVLLLVQAAVPGSWIVTPSREVVAGLLEKLGHDIGQLSQGELDSLAWSRSITTPAKLRNAMLAGRFTEDVTALLFDEGHHATARSWREVELLAGSVPSIAVTATPFRGTPKGTRELRDAWGEPVWVLTFPEAVGEGVIALPTCSVVPLVDDDVVEVQAGEFAVAAVEAALKPRLTAAADLVEQWVIASINPPFDRPTMASLPSVETAYQFARELLLRGIPARGVTGETPYAERQDAFASCVERRSILVQVAVVSEGVDLPVRRLLDLSPTLSPVKWLQQFGRITRPVRGEPAPEYIGTNRNLLRHAYLLDGCLPSTHLAAAQAMFPESRRDTQRALGLEALGRLKPCPVPLADGLRGTCYAFSALEGGQVREYAVLLHPCKAEPLWATRANAINEDGTRAYGRWSKCEPPQELTGFASLPPSEPSPKQKAWWQRSAARHGLDPNAPVTRKSFVALPVLSDLRERL